jgi:Soluble lytic murein transglycosylase and related regulatory proteins (some contain LysM/invasin domains)
MGRVRSQRFLKRSIGVVFGLSVLLFTADLPDTLREPAVITALPSVGPDILLLGTPRLLAQTTSDWRPSEVLDDMRGTVLHNQIHAVLSQHLIGCSPEERERLTRVIVEECQQVGVDPFLVLALIHVESSFLVKAISPVGARGLMQIAPETARQQAEKLGMPWSGPDQLDDPEINVRLGVTHLSDLLRIYRGNQALAFTAYHCGQGCVEMMFRRFGRLDIHPGGYFEIIQRLYRNYLRQLDMPTLALLQTHKMGNSSRR